MTSITLRAAAALIAIVVAGCAATATPAASTTGPASTGPGAGSTGAASTAGAAGSVVAGNTSGPAGSATAGSTGATAGAGIASCHQQFVAWQNGPAKSLGEQIVPALEQVEAAASVDDVPSLTSTLRQAGKLAPQLQAHPMPTCADPKGYWRQILAALTAAGDSASSAHGLTALLAAVTPLEKISLVETQLSTELTSTAGA